MSDSISQIKNDRRNWAIRRYYQKAKKSILPVRVESYETPLIIKDEMICKADKEPMIGFVYFIYMSNYPIDENEKYFKVGRTNNLYSRLSTLQTGNPFALKIYKFIKSTDYINIENHLHDRLKSKNIMREWFKISFNEVDEIVKEYEIKQDAKFEPEIEIKITSKIDSDTEDNDPKSKKEPILN